MAFDHYYYIHCSFLLKDYCSTPSFALTHPSSLSHYHPNPICLLTFVRCHLLASYVWRSSNSYTLCRVIILFCCLLTTSNVFMNVNNSIVTCLIIDFLYVVVATCDWISACMSSHLTHRQLSYSYSPQPISIYCPYTIVPEFLWPYWPSHSIPYSSYLIPYSSLSMLNILGCMTCFNLLVHTLLLIIIKSFCSTLINVQQTIYWPDSITH